MPGVRFDARASGSGDVTRAHAIVDQYVRRIDGATGTPEGPFDHLERDFVSVARCFSDHHGISYGAWVDVGVSPATLRRAGIHPAGASRRFERRSRTGSRPRQERE
jgi:hypothetical protein